MLAPVDVILSLQGFSFTVLLEKAASDFRGSEFRPSYVEVGILPSITRAPLLFLTATASPKVCRDIFSAFMLEEKNVTHITRLPDR
jgi:superfamily II DNA helicase RecQ